MNITWGNVAHVVVSLETSSADPVTEEYSLTGQVQIFNQLGQWIATWDDASSKRVVKPVVDLPNGLYTLRATIGGRVITKPLAIVRLY